MSFCEEIIGDARLICADCRDVLPTLGKVDAVVTDPPYGIGFKYESHDDTADGYGEFIWSVIEQCENLCWPGSPIFVWQAMLNAGSFHQWFPRNWRIFAALKNFVQVRPTPMQYAWDPILVWWTPEGKPFRADNWGRDFFVADTASVVADSSQKFGHPCPRPLDHLDYIIERFVKPRACVLDPFAGSGTTGVACAKLGRKFIGIEIEPKYFDIACRRIEAAYKQPDMFIPRPAPATQEALDV